MAFQVFKSATQYTEQKTSTFLLLCCITCCDYDGIEKRATVISQAPHVCCSSSGGRDFYGFMILDLESRVARLKTITLIPEL